VIQHSLAEIKKEFENDDPTVIFVKITEKTLSQY